MVSGVYENLVLDSSIWLRTLRKGKKNSWDFSYWNSSVLKKMKNVCLCKNQKACLILWLPNMEEADLVCCHFSPGRQNEFYLYAVCCLQKNGHMWSNPSTRDVGRFQGKWLRNPICSNHDSRSREKPRQSDASDWENTGQPGLCPQSLYISCDILCCTVVICQTELIYTIEIARWRTCHMDL